MRMRENVTAVMILLFFYTNRQVVKLFVVWEKERGRKREREKEREREERGEYTYTASQ